MKCNKEYHYMISVYEEFGIDIHSIPNDLQSSMNDLVKEIIKLRML